MTIVAHEIASNNLKHFLVKLKTRCQELKFPKTSTREK